MSPGMDYFTRPAASRDASAAAHGHTDDMTTVWEEA